jgi:hypothetical protein
VSDEVKRIGVEATALSDARLRDFDEWVERRLWDWPSARILAFERWLLDRGELEFVPSLRAALQERESAA